MIGIATGYISVHVTCDQGSMPLLGTRVMISRKQQGMKVYEDIFPCDEQGVLSKVALFADEKQCVEYEMDIQKGSCRLCHIHIPLYPCIHYELLIDLITKPARSSSMQEEYIASVVSLQNLSYALCYQNPTLPAEMPVQTAKDIRKQMEMKDRWITLLYKDAETRSYFPFVKDTVMQKQLPLPNACTLSVPQIPHAAKQIPLALKATKDVDSMQQLDRVLRAYACKKEKASFTDDVRSFQRLLALPIDGIMHSLEKNLLLEITQELSVLDKQEKPGA